MKTQDIETRRRTVAGRCLVVMIVGSALAGCVQIKTPDKPIEINLNINIRQEVVYRIDGDVKQRIEQNSSIF